MMGILAQVEIRRPKTEEFAQVRNLVQIVVNEIYGNLWADPPLPISEQDWSSAWVAVCGGTIAGVTLTQDEWLDDLWVHRSYRGAGIGRLLLERAEVEIASRGCPIAKLRVVASNRDAMLFYERSGWSVQCLFPHETFPIEMAEMTKSMSPNGNPIEISSAR